jgi:hypothetical protein
MRRVKSRELAHYRHSKFAASSVLPEPVQMATDGCGQSGRERSTVPFSLAVAMSWSGGRTPHGRADRSRSSSRTRHGGPCLCFATGAVGR